MIKELNEMDKLVIKILASVIKSQKNTMKIHKTEDLTSI